MLLYTDKRANHSQNAKLLNYLAQYSIGHNKQIKLQNGINNNNNNDSNNFKLSFNRNEMLLTKLTNTLISIDKDIHFTFSLTCWLIELFEGRTKISKLKLIEFISKTMDQISERLNKWLEKLKNNDVIC